MPVQLLNGLLRICVRGHFDESEAARLPGGTIGDDRHRFTNTGLREQLLEILVGDVEGEVADVKLLSHVTTPSLGRCCDRVNDEPMVRGLRHSLLCLCLTADDPLSSPCAPESVSG